MSRQCVLLGKFARSFRSLVTMYSTARRIRIPPSLERVAAKFLKSQSMRNQRRASINPDGVLNLGNDVLLQLAYAPDSVTSIREGLKVLGDLSMALPIHQSNRNAFEILAGALRKRLVDINGEGSLNDRNVYSAVHYFMAMICVADQDDPIPRDLDIIANGLLVGIQSKIL